jgi:hypothetical protein
MIIHGEIIQGSEQWDELRLTRPTASEFSKIYTGGGKLSAQREAYMRRLSIARKYVLPTFQGNQWTDRGHELEPVARERFIQETGFDVRNVGFITRDDQMAGGSPDGMIYDSSGQPVGGIEIKCFNVDKHLGILEKGKLPTENAPQVHGHLWITGLPAWVFILYCPEAFPLDFRMIEVTPDGYTREVGAAVAEFCSDYQRNWPRYLAEFEADQIGLSVETMLPVLSRKMKAKTTPKPEPQESLI